MFEWNAAISFYLSSVVLGLVVWPITRVIFRKFPDAGWGFSKIIGILLIGWLMWLTSSLKILSFSLDNLLLLTALLAFLILYQHEKTGELLFDKAKSWKRAQEILEFPKVRPIAKVGNGRQLEQYQFLSKWVVLSARKEYTRQTTSLIMPAIE